MIDTKFIRMKIYASYGKVDTKLQENIIILKILNCLDK